MLQGSLQVKDFDIKKAAGGVTFKAFEEILTARVSDNYLEIHLLWAGKGTCCIPSPGTYGPAISAIKVKPGNLKLKFEGFLQIYIDNLTLISFCRLHTICPPSSYFHKEQEDWVDCRDFSFYCSRGCSIHFCFYLEEKK